jgi:pyruvate dehydrogenase E2 component (dihydrolipoamide acetyltransferase)
VPAQAILMPKLGLTMTEGMLIEWKVAPGDRVAPGDVLFVVETDKISNEIEAADAGTVEALHVAESETVAVGTPVATLVVEGPELARIAVQTAPLAAQPAEVLGATASAPTPGPAPSDRTGPEPVEVRYYATPLARRVARQAGLDLGEITGTGPRGRITSDDVTAAQRAPSAPPSMAPEPPTADEPSELVALNSVQKVTARRLSEAKRNIPHFYVFAEADVTALLELREQLNSDAAHQRISVSHFILAAMSRALVAMPTLNRVWSDAGLVQLRQADVGLAVEGPKGLLAPVLRNLGRSTVDEVAAAATQAVGRVRGGQVSSADLQGGATALSNVGMFGATGLVPIINPGQSSILGVGRNQGVFRPDAHGQPQLRQVLNLALSCDHRVVDGAEAARFLQIIQNGLEAPAALLRRVPEDLGQ